jgi:hypothetical protein
MCWNLGNLDAGHLQESPNMDIEWMVHTDRRWVTHLIPCNTTKLLHIIWESLPWDEIKFFCKILPHFFSTDVLGESPWRWA